MNDIITNLIGIAKSSHDNEVMLTKQFIKYNNLYHETMDINKRLAECNEALIEECQFWRDVSGKVAIGLMSPNDVLLIIEKV